ncbi:MAG: hypothetical protein J6Y35_01785 [Bacteroidales bacterium]|nr:hypothetical protein [Bacteroidales bacterium]
MDFITIDFETANSERCSPCEIGLTFVENNEIKDSVSWLIKPMDNCYDFFNTEIHGLSEKDTENEPEFNVIWEKVHPLIHNKFIIAHNAGFDMSVLRKTLDLYNIPYPSFTYACSYKFSKKTWPGLPSYNLFSLCSYLGISFQHHRAKSDSLATAKLSLLSFNKMNVQTEDDFIPKLQTRVGCIFDGGYKPCRTYHQSTNHSKFDYRTIVPDVSKIDEDNLFYKKNVVFTGTLSSMKRSEAQQIIADIGGVNSNSISKKTDFLVVGQQDYRIVGEDGMSSKQEKAMVLINEGCPIEILSEEDFIKNIQKD